MDLCGHSKVPERLGKDRIFRVMQGNFEAKNVGETGRNRLSNRGIVYYVQIKAYCAQIIFCGTPEARITA